MTSLNKNYNYIGTYNFYFQFNLCLMDPDHTNKINSTYIPIYVSIYILNSVVIWYTKLCVYLLG